MGPHYFFPSLDNFPAQKIVAKLIYTHSEEALAFLEMLRAGMFSNRSYHNIFLPHFALFSSFHHWRGSVKDFPEGQVGHIVDQEDLLALLTGVHSVLCDFAPSGLIGPDGRRRWKPGAPHQAAPRRDQSVLYTRTHFFQSSPCAVHSVDFSPSSSGSFIKFEISVYCRIGTGFPPPTVQ